VGVLIVRSRRAREIAARIPFVWYVLGVGLISAAVVVAVRPIDGMPLRYLLLTFFIPIGLASALFAMEQYAWIRRAVVAAVLGWAAVGAVDHLRLAARHASGAEPNRVRHLADALIARGVTVSEATYWRAYNVTFIAQERVKVSALDHSRIDEYARLARAEGDRLRRITEQPCEGGEEVAGYYLCPVR
jgi:hypothetical protein